RVQVIAIEIDAQIVRNGAQPVYGGRNRAVEPLDEIVTVRVSRRPVPREDLSRDVVCLRPVDSCALDESSRLGLLLEGFVDTRKAALRRLPQSTICLGVGRIAIV